MKFKKLSSIILAELKQKLKQHRGLSIFAREKAKFEGWFKVELCETLSKHFKNVIPEKDKIDVTFDNWLLELKTLNTNYSYKGVKDKGKPITDNTQGVIDDILKLKKIRNKNRAVLFIVFPCTHNNPYWQTHLKKIERHLTKYKHTEFNFNNNIPAVIYMGLI